jgi:hypothetical protein
MIISKHTMIKNIRPVLLIPPPFIISNIQLNK